MLSVGGSQSLSMIGCSMSVLYETGLRRTMHLLQGGLKLNGKWTNDELLLAVQGAVIVEHC